MFLCILIAGSYLRKRCKCTRQMEAEIPLNEILFIRYVSPWIDWVVDITAICETMRFEVDESSRTFLKDAARRSF